MKFILLLLLALPALAEEPAVVREARRALAEGLPQVAMAKLETALKARTFPTDERPPALRLLAEAQITAGQGAAALETLRPLQETTDPAVRLLRAHALAATGRWDEALPIYEALNGLPGVPPAAALGEAESLQALGRTAEAVVTLEQLNSSGKASVVARLRLASLLVELGQPEEARKLLAKLTTGTEGEAKWRRYIEARTLLLEKKPDNALHEAEQILAEKAGLSPELAAATTLAAAEAKLAQNAPDAAGTAAKMLESFIRQNPNSPQIEMVFRRLDQIYTKDKNPAEGPLHGFVSDLPPRVGALAQFYVARLQFRQADYGKAELSLVKFLKDYPGHELTTYVHELRAKIALKDKRNADAEAAYDEAIRVTSSEELRAQFAFSAALIDLEQRDFEHATTRLRAAANSPRLRQSATYDAALSWLFRRNYPRFREEVAAFASQFTAPMLIGQLRLEEGLMLARTRSTEATPVVEAFLRDFPKHPRQDEARLALAEIAFQEGRPEAAGALAGTVKGGPATAEQNECLSIFLEEEKRPRNNARVIELARKFIADHPQSPQLPEVRMKLGQVYFTTEDYLKAQEQFATLAEEQPADGKYAEAALFLAGQCGTKLITPKARIDALEFFGKVAARKGPLETQARLQQAIIKNKLDEYSDAAKICDSILSTAGVQPEVRAAALIGKGDNLVAQFRKETPADPTPDPAATKLRESYLLQAIAAYDTLLATPEAASPTPAGTPPAAKWNQASWRNQAAYKKGDALLQLERTAEALAVFYDVINRTEATQRETFWFSKAGEAAVAILQKQDNWQAAANIYKKMARVPGPHVPNAERQIKKLQLEHYLWD